MTLATLQATVSSILSTNTERSIKPQDFPEGFLIEEILPSGSVYKKINLIGNMMPMIPFTYGGIQRIKKDFYSGDSEPAIQILGSEEKDTVIKGVFKDKRYNDDKFAGVSLEITQFIDAIRLRGNLCRFVLGEWQRYGIIEETTWDMKKISQLGYAIKLSIIGFNAPKNAKFMEQKKTVPFVINQKLIAEAQAFEDASFPIPASVPRSIGDKLNELTGAVAGAIALVTDFIDNIFQTIQDTQKAVERGKGLVKHAVTKANDYKRSVAAFNAFDTEGSLTGQYQNASYYQRNISGMADMTAILVSLRSHLTGMTSNIPQARHLVTQNDSLQSIAIKYFGSADEWKTIYDYNKLTTTDLDGVNTLDIPRP